MHCTTGLAAVLIGFSTALFGAPLYATEPSTSYLDLNFRQNRYMGGVQHSAQDANYTLLSADLNLQTQTEGFRYRLNPVAQGNLESREEFYFGVPEAYVQLKKIAPWFNLTIGRQKRTWSRLDEEFNLGIWQPQLRWDYLAPVQQGLTGVFFDWNLSRSVALTFFTSPVFLPDQGPQYRLRDGKFESNNRWFVQPQSRLDLFQGTKFASQAPLYFEIDQPSEEEIVMNPSFGLGLRYQHEGSPLWTQVNYAYKPRNQIHLGIECSNCVNIASSAAEVTAVIHPKVINHHVVTVETGFERIDDRGWVSLTGDFPKRSDFPEAYEEAPLNSTVVAGIAYQHYIGHFARRPSWLQYSYMRTWEFTRESEGSLVSEDQVESSLDRYPFQEIAALDWRILLVQRAKNKIGLRNRYSYSIPEQGGWLSSSAEWQRGAFALSLGVDVLGADVDPDSKEAGLFSRYRANDRFFGGLTYVF